jgi:hypothetical protein
MEQQLTREIRLEERKNKVIEDLSVQFSRNELPMEEYERLVEYINKAETERELVIIEKIARENSLYSGGSENRQQERYAESRRDSDSNFDEGKTSFALLSTRHLSGDFFSGQSHSLFSVLGSHEIDFDEGDLPNGRTEISVISLLGDTKIRVPPNVKVKINAIPILGEATVARNNEAVSNYGPELVINGVAILSSIKVKYVDKNKRERGKWFS